MKKPNPNTVKAKRYFVNNPWARHVLWARERCRNPKAKAWPSHGAKGIKVFLTMKEAKELWHKAEAWKMEKPSLDRRESDKHYCIHNCRFIEFALNSRLPHDAALRAEDRGDPSWLHEDVTPDVRLEPVYDETEPEFA